MGSKAGKDLTEASPGGSFFCIALEWLGAEKFKARTDNNFSG